MTLATTTDLWYLRQEIIGEPSLKRGVTGEISKYAMKDLAGAFESFVKINQLMEMQMKRQEKSG